MAEYHRSFWRIATSRSNPARTDGVTLVSPLVYTRDNSYVVFRIIQVAKRKVDFIGKPSNNLRSFGGNSIIQVLDIIG